MTIKTNPDAINLTQQEDYKAWVDLFIYCLRENQFLKKHIAAQKQGDYKSIIASNHDYWKKFDPGFFKELSSIKQNRLSELPEDFLKEISESTQAKLDLISSRVTLLEDILDDFSEFINCSDQKLDTSSNYVKKVARKLLLNNSQSPQLQIIREGEVKQSIGNRHFIEEDCLVIKLPIGQEMAETKRLAELLLQGAYYHSGEAISAREFSKQKKALIPNHLTFFEVDNPVDKKRGWSGDYQFCAINRDLNQYLTIILCWHLRKKEKMSREEIAIHLVQHQNRINKHHKLIGYNRVFPSVDFTDQELKELFADNSATYSQVKLYKYVGKWINAGQQIVDNVAMGSFPLHKPLV